MAQTAPVDEPIEIDDIPGGADAPVHQTLDHAATTGFLQHAAITSISLIPWGSNYTFLATLAGDQTAARDLPYAETSNALAHDLFNRYREQNPDTELAADDAMLMLGIYKPVRGEAPLWDFPNGTLYKREHAAYLFAHLLGWDFIPPVVVRDDGPHGTGTLQLFVDVEEDRTYYDFRADTPDELRKIALFDLITNNADRKIGHVLLGTDAQVWGIDHGLTFNSVPKLRTVIWDFIGQRIPDLLVADLTRLCDDWSTVKDVLDEWLDKHEIEVTRDRVQSVLRSGTFPMLNPQRNRPWGF